MSEPDPRHWPTRLVARRIEKKGLRPRIAAGVIASVWLVAIVVFGIVQHLFDPESFDTVWDGMWWATQTVTTVGYGDVVPDQGAGRIIAGLLMIGGLSLFAVITGLITSAFVGQEHPLGARENGDPVLAKLTELQTQLTAIESEMARLSSERDPGPDQP